MSEFRTPPFRWLKPLLLFSVSLSFKSINLPVAVSKSYQVPTVSLAVKIKKTNVDIYQGGAEISWGGML